MAGTPESYEAFRQLVVQLLSLTVMKKNSSLRLTYEARNPFKTVVLGGMRLPTDPIPLNDKKYLRLTMSLWLAPTEEGTRLKVKQSACQYQLDPLGNSWVWRYDYLRDPSKRHPSAHFQILGTVKNLPEAQVPLHRVHFPTGRVSLEAIIRLLADEFNVPCNTEDQIWRPVLAESERIFEEIAHRPIG